MLPKRSYEIRSSDYDEIIGRKPTWIIRYGIAAIFVLFVVIFLALFLIQYPDKVPARGTLLTDPPPLSIISKKSGTLTFYVQDNDLVKKGDILGQIDHQISKSDFQHIEQLLCRYDSLRSDATEIDRFYRDIPHGKFLGPLQASYMQFITSIDDLRTYHIYRHNIVGLQMTKAQLDAYGSLTNEMKAEIELYKQNLSLAKRRFQVDSALGADKILAPLQLDDSKLTLLDRQITMQKAVENLITTKSQESQLAFQIQLIRNEDIRTLRMLELSISTAAKVLRSEMQHWAEENFLVAPMNGVVSYADKWSDEQPVVTGGVMFRIIPAETNRIEVRAVLPIEGSGKVESGQQVHIKLDNFPYEEYGLLYGKVEKISPVPVDDNQYAVNISLNNGLTSSFKKKIHFRNEMQATVEIVTKRRSVIERLISKIVKTAANN